MNETLRAPRLVVDLDAVAANYRYLAATAAHAACGAAVKGDGYGLGALEVSRRLVAEGCRTFFVATLDEALELRAASLGVGRTERRPAIVLLGGPLPGTEAEIVGAGVTPVLNSVDQARRWADAARRVDRRLPAVVHVDTGMERLGLPHHGLAAALDEIGDALNLVDVVGVMSHLACADDPDHELNRLQLERFAAARRLLPDAPASLANSAGILLGEAWHLDLVRPGIGLYGGAPRPSEASPMRPTVRLEAPIVQVRDVPVGATVGYGATHTTTAPTTTATVAVGYADGFLRTASSRGSAAIAGVRVPIIGRVSMDLITLDVSTVERHHLHEGAPVELIGPTVTVDEVAEAAGTISYEILTDLGARYERVVVGAGSGPARGSG